MSAALVLTGLVLTGCSGAVSVPDPAPTGADVSTCSQLIAALPAQVLSQDRRKTEPGAFSAAWGDPVITLRCGVPKPSTLTPASQCLEVDGVGWLDEAAQGGRLFTTIGRQTYVELAVPSSYAPEAGALADVAAVIRAHDRVRQPCV